MNYWIAFVIQNNSRWYISRMDTDSNKRIKDATIYSAHFGPELAFQFKTKEEAMDAVALFCEDKPEMKLAGLAEINLYSLV